MSRHKTPEAAAHARDRAVARRERTEERKTARHQKYSPRVIY